MAFTISIDELVSQATTNTPYTFGNTYFLGAQAAGFRFSPATIYALGVQAMFRSCPDMNGNRLPVGKCPDAEDSEMIYTDIFFPECISYGSTGSPIYMTDKTEVASGAESRNSRWDYPKHEYSILLEEIPAEEISKIVNIWHVCAGSHAGFLFLDPSDHTSSNTTASVTGSEVSPTDQRIGTALGITTSYPLYKHYQEASRTRKRRIAYPQDGSLRVAIDGFECFNWSYSYSTKMLTFTLAFGERVRNLTKTGNIITGDTFPGLQVGDLLYISGWTDNDYNFPEGGDPVRVRAVSSTELELEKFDGSDYGPVSFPATSVTMLPCLPPTGAELTAGFYFYVPVRFDDDDNLGHELTSGMRESAIATFEDITLREIQE